MSKPFDIDPDARNRATALTGPAVLAGVSALALATLAGVLALPPSAPAQAQAVERPAPNVRKPEAGDRGGRSAPVPGDRPGGSQGGGANAQEQGPSLDFLGPHAEKPFAQAFQQGFPETPRQRAKVLSNLYAYLATAPDATSAAEIAAVIERVWLISGSDTISVLMERAMRAATLKQYDLSIRLLDAVVELAPDFPEGWNRRAFVHFMSDNRVRALGDLRRALALDPSHFKAMQGLAQIMKESDEKAAALKAYRKLREIHPFAEGLEESIRELEAEIEGQGI
jgi:tetratricopeptide (TPR) repeat protein